MISNRSLQDHQVAAIKIHRHGMHGGDGAGAGWGFPSPAPDPLSVSPHLVRPLLDLRFDPSTAPGSSLAKEPTTVILISGVNSLARGCPLGVDEDRVK